MSRQYIVELAQSVAHHDAKNLFKQFPTAVRTIIEQELWADRTDKDGNPFPSFQAFAEHRLWQGLELPMDRLLRYCEDDEEAVRLIKGEMPEAGSRGAPNGNDNRAENRENKGSDTTFELGRGQQYQLARLKRDHPELAKHVIDGDLTPHAAAVQAGFVARYARIQPTPEGIQRWLNVHMPEWRLVNIQTGEAIEVEGK